MPEQWKEILSAAPQLTFTSALDILLVATIIYQALLLVRGRRAASVLFGVTIVFAAYALAVTIGLTVLRSVLEALAPYTAFALIVMFQNEIRRLFTRIGERKWAGFGGRVESREVADEIVLAVSHLAAHRIGALIVIEGEVGLRTFIESGVPIDARVTRDLLLAIFQPGGPLHDGAAIVQGGRLAAASCFLPLTMNPELSRVLGTRHRAAIGISEDSDCLAIVVSEERGVISVAQAGELESDVTPERLAERLRQPARTVRAYPQAAKEGARR
ncbi:MAG: diadenylate cyclase CdaA [Bryobacteraceae bacterium]|nr:diadenylate cyclase CdaA [Bryobacteraceae bacterium]MCX7605032.1 diadenylate cyclase CdaA [Bryobacteraceae bacterium]